MPFTAPSFLLVFLPAFLCLYYLARGVAWRNRTALAFSLLFFAWGEPVFVWYVVGGTALDYVLIRRFLARRDRSDRVRRLALVTGIAINVGGLVFFKYANFILDQIEPLLAAADARRPAWYPVALPLGISFIAFHKISFLVDLYKGRSAPPTSFIDALLYILFFPQLIAGPIVRYHEIREQIDARSIEVADFGDGFFRFARGLARKALIADPAGVVAGSVFALPPEAMPATFAWIGVLGYAVQIYFDFSGYSDMAIGLARMAGFRFPENFNRPYVSRSVTEFWRRWHITLSNWMRLYVYVPLGGNRVPAWRMYLNLWIVFLVSGLWHGAAWTFVAWGAYYGFFLTLERIWERRRGTLRIHPFLAQAATFLVVVTAWVLFRSDSLPYAMGMLGRLYGFLPQSAQPPAPFALFFQPYDLAVVALGLAFALLPAPNFRRATVGTGGSTAVDMLRWASGPILFLVALTSVLASGTSPFLYFRF
jgi:alginate O-acetyltransferase complex protein AlgI